MTPDSKLEQSPDVLAASTASGRYTQDNLVTLLVGPTREKLVVHGHCLTRSSEFFQAALKKEWKEGQTRTIKLPESKTGEVEQYLDFVYEGLLVSHLIQTGNDLKEADSQMALCRLYTFAERVLDTPLRNAIVEEQLRLLSLEDDDRSCWCPSWGSAAAIYEGTPASSPMRRFVLDVIVTRGRAQWIDDDEGLPVCPRELLTDVVREFIKKAQEQVGPKDFRHRALKAEDYFV